MFSLVMLCASVFIAHGELPYNEGDEQPCSGRQGTDIGESMKPDQVLDEFAKSLIGMTYGQARSNSQVTTCYDPSSCDRVWSAIGAKRLKDVLHQFRAKGLIETSEALARLYNTLVGVQSWGTLSNLAQGWRQLPLVNVRQVLRRKFCAFKILDENTFIYDQFYLL